jgi:hypothetical protein
MQFEQFVGGYRSGQVAAKVDRSRAMYVCDRSARLPKHYKAAHSLWKNISFLLVAGGLVSLFWVPWYVGLGAFALGVVMAPAVQKSAAQFVLEHALEDADFYEEMVSAGVLQVAAAERR